MGEKLLDQRIAVAVCLGKQKDAGRKAIDAMHNQGALTSRLELSDQQRQRGRNIGAFDRHSQQPSRLVEDNHSIIFIEHGNFAGETRLAACRALRSEENTSELQSHSFISYAA